MSDKIADKELETNTAHICGPQGECGCNCPESCGHKWDGPQVAFDGCVSVTCSKCGMPAINHDMWVLP